MITLQSGINTKKDFTLREKSTLESYSYLLFFVADHEGQQYGCKVTDVSTFPERYQRFSINVTANPVPLNGEVALYKEGFYHYYAYEINDIDTFDFSWIGNLDFTDLQTYLEENHAFTGEVNLLEPGKMKYLGESTEYSHYADTRTAVKSYGQ